MITTEHSLNQCQISPNAVKVLKQLHKAGFECYLVGGGVRDLLLGKHPKDFDIATNATPEQVRQLFRGARIIGRRFKIVHVRMGREILEVTTFRGTANNDNQQVRSDEGQLLRDNVYGTLKSDALRRDFTVNALYYHLQNNTITDFTGGLDDLNKRLLRIIGQPEVRYQEDPVRLLRVVRFAVKLGFHIEQETLAPIHSSADRLTQVPAARLFDELLKLLLTGHALATYHALQEHGLFEPLFPQTHQVLDDQPNYRLLLEQVMINTDDRIEQSKRVTPAYILAALLWPAMLEQKRLFEQSGMNTADAFNEAANLVVRNQVARITIPKRFSIPMRQIWELQWRLPKRYGRRARSLFEHPKFRAGYDFVLLRESAGEDLDQLGDWWTRYQELNEHDRDAFVSELKKPSKPKTSS